MDILNAIRLLESVNLKYGGKQLLQDKNRFQFSHLEMMSYVVRRTFIEESFRREYFLSKLSISIILSISNVIINNLCYIICVSSCT